VLGRTGTANPCARQRGELDDKERHFFGRERVEVGNAEIGLTEPASVIALFRDALDVFESPTASAIRYAPAAPI
jgi:hypothetical protein